MSKTISLTIFMLIVLGYENIQARPDLSLGLYGGINYPIIQEDARTGPGVGIKATFAPVSLVAVAAFFEARAYHNSSRILFRGSRFEQTIIFDGGRVRAYGAQLLLGNNGRGTGAHFYWMFGIGQYDWTRLHNPRLHETFYHAGQGLEIGVTGAFGIEASVKFEVVPTDGGGSRKNLLALLGANYHFAL